ncbi:MAG: response regulator [Micavibrio aeruginosavorus]|uniref:Response regulator n=1 Tax=Micavibrio aeruginosavorus TaxID=349221 RepID=A0A2W5MQL3_9BACT|nr:MAG: response regulator [Micavibrio aeruginosavorus]
MSYDLSQVKILIVEDMQPMLTLTTSMLGVFGFRNIHGAKTADEGFHLFRQHKHDLVITDWLMEPKDGLELIAMIRRSEYSPNPYVPIILMTGYSDQPRVETARDQGVTEFLMKPYSARDMYARIVQIIEKPRQFVNTGEFFGPDRRRRKNFQFYGDDRRGAHDKDTQWPEDIEIELRTLRDDVKKI